MNTSRSNRITYIILGSGGHTAEMCGIVQSLHKFYRNRFQPCYYLLASSDTSSRRKIIDSMEAFNTPIREDAFIEIPRSRYVGQNWFLTIFTTIWAMMVSFWLVLRDKPSFILCNGPGTCVPICLAGCFFRLLGILPRQTKIVFVESICRVKSLSLSGRILQPFADLVVVQWEALAEHCKAKSNVKYFGRLM